ncbi:MAG: DNA gyrase inhibitor YacG [Cellvibrionaceae bacterium]|nr:DNA gyrase inhibitor YacG [Cellvibrionaceae bacterium]
MTIKTLSVRCPSCQKEVLMTPAFPDRPFCSRRCKLIDLGEWASEGHRIAGEPVMDEMRLEDERDHK